MQSNRCLVLVVFAISIFLVNIEKVLAKSVRTMVNNEPPNCVLVETLLLAQHNFSVSYQQTGFANKEKKEDQSKDGNGGVDSGEHSNNKSICDGKCCDKNAESQLKLHVQKEFSTLVSDNLMSFNSLLGSISDNFQNHVIDLTTRAENKTSVLMKKIYHRMAVLAEGPIKMLFADIRRYTQVQELDNDISSGKLDIKTTIMSFFTSIFPLVYHHAAHPNSPKDFSPSYKNCLKNSFEAIQAFGNIPQEVSSMLQKSLESTRLLLQAFQAGKDVLNTTNDIIVNSPQQTCIHSLMKMINCPKCLGYNQEVKPCPGFCLNVFRGCLNTIISDLDSPWKSYVEAIEKMIYISRNDNNELGINIDIAIRNLNLKISESIMESIENAASLKSYTELQCGPVEFAKSEELEYSAINDSENQINLSVRAIHDQNNTSSELAENERWRMLGQIVRKADFFGNLADNLCKDSTFAESKDQDCWNGQNIGQYVKTIIEAKYSMQKYNPEIKMNESLNNYPTSLLADKLRHVHHIIMAQINTDNYVDSDNNMQGDAADGSGSGDEADYETDISGSGDSDSAESFTKSYGNQDMDTDTTTTSTAKTETEPLPPPKKGFATQLETSKLFTLSVSLGVLFLKAQFLLNC